MSAPMRNAAEDDAAGDRDRFSPEVFTPSDDVTPAAVQALRDKAKTKLSGKKWKLVDGFGLSQAE